MYLVRNPGRLLTRDELIQALWPDSYVEEGNLSVHIFQVRRALGTAADGQAYIQTVPKKGYRFNAEVQVVDQPFSELGRPAFDSRDMSSAVSDTGPHGGGQRLLCRRRLRRKTALPRKKCRRGPVPVLGSCLPEVLSA